VTHALRVAEVFRQVLVPFLIGAAALLAVLLMGIVVQHAIREARLRARRRDDATYEPIVAQALAEEDAESALDALRHVPTRHRPVVARLLLAAVRSLRGAPVARALSLAQAIGLTPAWREDLDNRHWWRRAEAVRALGLVREISAYDAIVAALDDAHEEVRAAAVDALGHLGDVRAVPPLLARLAARSGHQRVRLIEALRELGPAGGAHVLDHARRNPQSLPLLVSLLPAVAGSSATDSLLAWSAAPHAEVRAAALQAIATIGMDDRTFYYALRGLGDGDAIVRTAAARALGLSGRSDAAGYLAARLDDEWSVAANSARALARLGDVGRAALERRASSSGQAAELARQVLWQFDAQRPQQPRTRRADVQRATA